MGFEFGFAKYPYSEDDKFIRSEDNVYFFWCGWENVDIYNYFTAFGEKILVDEDGGQKYYEYKIKVKDLDFIETLYKQVLANENYNVIVKLIMAFNDDFVQTYIDALPIKEQAALRVAFILDDADWNTKIIGIELFKRLDDGYDMIGTLYRAYQHMLKDGVEFVYLYGG